MVGTLVWDTIHLRDGRGDPVEEWGGVSYALEALAASLPAQWRIVPILKVGRDLAEPALRFLGEIPRVNPHRAVRIVPEPNNRVELRYQDDERRCERLSGGVPAWSWEEFWPLAGDCDALYVNFISGFEMELGTAQMLREAFEGPIYADLHSLFLGIGRHGEREPRPLPLWDSWLRCFDAVQMNEDEYALLGRDAGDPWRLAAHVVGPDLKLVTVTMGSARGGVCRSAGFLARHLDLARDARTGGHRGPGHHPADRHSRRPARRRCDWLRRRMGSYLLRSPAGGRPHRACDRHRQLHGRPKRRTSRCARAAPPPEGADRPPMNRATPARPAAPTPEFAGCM